ncbi:MAG: lysophospholipase [Candidatus Obscuribacterales bacterium]|nr:lysophospholipase [Candidatus Obscuribacterales bacterium]
MKIINTFNLKNLLAAGVTLISLIGAQYLAPDAMAAYSPIRGEINESLFGDLHLPMYVWSKGISDPNAIVVAIHGGCLHGKTFEALGEALSAKNVMVVSTDLRGYGKWYYEDFGGQYNKTFHYKQSKKDLALIVTRLKEAYPGVPVYFIGESLGANMSLHMIGDYKHLADGAILCSTYSLPSLYFRPYMILSALQFLHHPFSQQSMVPYIKSRLSDTKQFSLQHLADPMARDHQTMKEMFQSMNVNRHGKHFATTIPADSSVLMIHGERDKLCALWSTKRLFAKIPAQDKTFAVIPKRGHLLVETPVLRPEVLEVLGHWLDTHSKSAPQYHHAVSVPNHHVGQAEPSIEEVSLN